MFKVFISILSLSVINYLISLVALVIKVMKIGNYWLISKAALISEPAFWVGCVFGVVAILLLFAYIYIPEKYTKNW